MWNSKKKHNTLSSSFLLSSLFLLFFIVCACVCVDNTMMMTCICCFLWTIMSQIFCMWYMLFKKICVSFQASPQIWHVLVSTNVYLNLKLDFVTWQNLVKNNNFNNLRFCMFFFFFFKKENDNNEMHTYMLSGHVKRIKCDCTYVWVRIYTQLIKRRGRMMKIHIHLRLVTFFFTIWKGVREKFIYVGDVVFYYYLY